MTYVSTGFSIAHVPCRQTLFLSTDGYSSFIRQPGRDVLSVALVRDVTASISVQKSVHEARSRNPSPNVGRTARPKLRSLKFLQWRARQFVRARNGPVIARFLSAAREISWRGKGIKRRQRKIAVAPSFIERGTMYGVTNGTFVGWWWFTSRDTRWWTIPATTCSLSATRRRYCR